jgi:hypothetical protein
MAAHQQDSEAQDAADGKRVPSDIGETLGPRRQITERDRAQPEAAVD